MPQKIDLVSKRLKVYLDLKSFFLILKGILGLLVKLLKFLRYCRGVFRYKYIEILVKCSHMSDD